MAKPIDKLAPEIRDLPDKEKLQLVDAILEELVKPDPEIDRIWAEEARKPWNAYKEGRVPMVSYDTVMANIGDREGQFFIVGTEGTR
jgi:Putative addiction module component